MQFSALALTISILAGTLFAASASAEIHVRKGGSFPTISAALAAARKGETILVAPGTYHERLNIDRLVTLKGESGSVTIDGDGKGTVVAVRAPGVVISHLRISGSGKIRAKYEIWGRAGIAIYADDVRIENSEIVNNESGILIWRASGAVIAENNIHDNAAEGLLAVGASAAVIQNNLVAGNGLTGIEIMKISPESPNDVRAPERRESLIIPTGNMIADNRVQENALAGIILNGARKSIVENNLVRNNRKAPSAYLSLLQSISNSPGEGVQIFANMDGSGILISCDATENVVRSNLTYGNQGPGITLYGSDDNDIHDNRVRNNRDGIMILASGKNRFVRNQVRSNARYGIAFLRLPLPNGNSNPFDSGGNLVWLNEFAENPTNAYDATSASRKSARDLLSSMQYLKRRMTPAQRRDLERALAKEGKTLADYERNNLHTLRKLKASATPNRWDAENRGNHYDDFDEPREGFMDRDGDGIGERPHHIAGGNAVDRHPLAHNPG